VYFSLKEAIPHRHRPQPHPQENIVCNKRPPEAKGGKKQAKVVEKEKEKGTGIEDSEQ